MAEKTVQGMPQNNQWKNKLYYGLIAFFGGL